MSTMNLESKIDHIITLAHTIYGPGTYCVMITKLKGGRIDAILYSQNQRSEMDIYTININEKGMKDDGALEAVDRLLSSLKSKLKIKAVEQKEALDKMEKIIEGTYSIFLERKDKNELSE